MTLPAAAVMPEQRTGYPELLYTRTVEMKNRPVRACCSNSLPYPGLLIDAPLALPEFGYGFAALQKHNDCQNAERKHDHDLSIGKCSEFCLCVRVFKNGERYGVIQTVRKYCRPEVSAE